MTQAVEFPQSVHVAAASPDYVVGFSFANGAELTVTVLEPDAEDASEAVTQVFDTAFIVTGDLLGGAGHVVFQVGYLPTEGATVTIERDTPLNQTANFGDLASFSPAAVGRALDRVARTFQDLRRDIDAGGGGGGGGGDVTWTSLPGKPATFPPSVHSHVISQITGLQTALDAKASTTHSHLIVEVTGLQTALDGKAASSHTHAAADITSGTFDTARIPSLAASIITSGTFDAARVPNLDAAKITTGTIDAARLPAAASGGGVVSGGAIADLTAPQQAAIVEGTVVTTTDGRRWSYKGSGSKVLEASYIELTTALDWSGVTSKPANVTALAGLTGAANKAAYFTGSGAMAVTDFTSYGRSIVAAANQAALRALSGAGNAPNFVDVFGGVADGVANNDAAFAAAEASAYSRIWLPEGTFVLTTNYRTLAKCYEGPGRLAIGSPAAYRFAPRALRTNPGYNTSADNLYGEDKVTKFSIVEDITINPSVARHRLNLNNTEPSYFGQQWAPRWVNLLVQDNGGYSGLTARIPAGVIATATSATFDSVEGLSAGMSIGFGTVMDDVQEIHTIDTIVGNVVTWIGGLTNSYPNQGIASGEYLGPSVTKGKRTWNSAYMVNLVGQSGGDNIAYGARLEAAYVPTGGQKHFFNTQTTGVLEGDITFSTKGNYGKVTEFSIIENTTATGGNGAICDVRTFYRTQAFAYGAVWGGYYITANPTAGFAEDRCDFAFNIGGKFIRGLDTYRADFTDGAAINLKDGHRVYFNSTQTTTGHPTTARGEGYYGNVIGDAWIGHSSSALSLNKGTGTPTILSLTASSITLNKQTEIVGALVCDSTIAVAGQSSMAGKLTISAGGLQVAGAVTFSNSMTVVNVTASGAISGASLVLSGAFNGSTIAGSTITGSTLTSTGQVNSTSGYYVGGTKVVGARAGSIPDATLDLSSCCTTLNALLAVNRTHGLHA